MKTKKYFAEDPGEDGRKQETYQQDSEPHLAATIHGSIYANGAYQSAGAHAGAGRDIFHFKKTGSYRAGDYGG